MPTTYELQVLLVIILMIWAFICCSYDNGITGGVVSMPGFLKKFFPGIHTFSFQITFTFWPPVNTNKTESCCWPSDASWVYTRSFLCIFDFNSCQGAPSCAWIEARQHWTCGIQSVKIQKSSAEIIWKSLQKNSLHLRDFPDHFDCLDADLVEHQSHPDPAGQTSPFSLFSLLSFRSFLGLLQIEKSQIQLLL